MSKEEIKNLLVDFICEYDMTSWSNGKVYEKFSDLIFKQITDLEAKLAESKKKIKGFVEFSDKKQHENYEQFCEIMQLKQQLAEKEKLLEINERILRGTKLVKQELEQEKISFAVEKLQEAKRLFEEKYTYDVEESDFAVIYEDDIDEIIDNQIKEIKGEK